MDVSKIVKEEQEGVWVDFSQVKIKPATPEMIRQLRKQCTTTKLKRGRPIDEVDNEQFVDLLSQEVVCDWKGFESGGKPLSCNPENIKLLMNKWAEFSTFVQEVALHIEDYLNEHERQAVKN